MNILQALDENYSDSDIAIKDSYNDYSVSQIRQRCDALEQSLSSHGINCFALYGDNSIDWIIADLVCQKLDATVLPLPTFFSSQQIEYAIEKCPVQALLCDSLETLSPTLASQSSYIEKVALSNLHLIRAASKCNPTVLPASTGKITFTSGSTGQPKGVCLSHQQQLAQASILASIVGIARPKHLCVLPLSTLLENVAGVYAPLLAQGQLIVPALSELGFSGSSLVAPEKLLSAISTTQPDSLILVPQLLSFLISAIAQGWRPPASLKFIAVGGGKVSTELLNSAAQHGLPVYEGYGLSECCSVVSLNTPSSNRRGSAGKLLSNLSLSFQNGQVYVSGNSMLGYVGEPNSWNKESVATGDLGKLDADGFLYINGRCKNVLISSFGRNISPEWIESELTANPLIKEAIVIGDARPYCTAIVSLSTSQDEAKLEPWIEQVNNALPDYARIKFWHVSPRPLSEMPTLYTENGKPKREAINIAFAKQIETLYQSSAAA
jgi:long-chain acyl-CoA synthetase